MNLLRRLCGEALGTLILLAAVVGSGIMGERLCAGNLAIALLTNAIATGAALTVLITVLGPVSGAHFNPVVTLVFAVRGEIGWRAAFGYAVTQVIGAVAGVLLAHAMFGEAMFQVSARPRDGPAQLLSEFVATFGLILVILGTVGRRPDAVPVTVGLYITAAYWFTASTSFANPAVTLARSLSNTFAGIAPASTPMFMLAQVAGAIAAAVVGGWMFGGARAPQRIESGA